MIKLYHYSNKDFKGYIKPSFFGLNNYSRNSERLSGVERSYYYTNQAGREYYFNRANYCYIAEIKEGLLYNLDKDPLKLAGRVKDIYSAVKSRDYKGIISGNIAVLFYWAKIKQRKTLTEAGRYVILKLKKGG